MTWMFTRSGSEQCLEVFMSFKKKKLDIMQINHANPMSSKTIKTLPGESKCCYYVACKTFKPSMTC